MKSKKFLLNGLIVLILLSMLNCSLLTYATEVADETTEDTSETTESTGGWISDPYERLGVTSDDGIYGLASSYDPRDGDYLTNGRDQGNTELCWMFATVAAVEQQTSMNFGSKFDLSEAHGGVALSNLIKPSAFNGNSSYYTRNCKAGGNYSLSLQYFTNWDTPIFNNATCQWEPSVSEDSYPLVTIYDSRVSADSAFTGSKSILNVTSAEYVSDNMSNIKQAILENGAVSTAVDISTDSYFSKDSNGEYNYFRGSASMPSGHAITIVGWNDNYSKDDFGISKPKSDGAWLVKNSYSDKQYFWLSYDEGSIEDNYFMTITGVEKASTNEKMLSYDYYPVGYTDNAFNDVVYLCNVFDVSGYTNSYEQINKVMFYLRSTGCTYDVKIAQLDSDGNLPQNINDFSSLATGEFNGEGYLTADLDTPYKFVSNNKCAIIIKLTPKTENSEIKIPFESNFKDEDDVYLTSEINSGESYYGFMDDENILNWNDCSSENEYGITGNLIIRPVLKDIDVEQANVNISPTQIIDNNIDVDIQIDSDVNLFNIHSASNYVLKQDVDYHRTDTGITLKADYINSLGGTYTELAFEFNNDTTKTVIINPKATITDITISGSPIVGDTLTATCVGIPEKDEYDVTYQWQSSLQGENWYDIAGATESSYTVAENVYNMYLRVKVTSVQFGNVVYPAEFYSDSTECKVVILGDVDSDGTVSINDATLLQKYLNYAAELSKEQLLAADVNRDGIVNISDATQIQKMIVS